MMVKNALGASLMLGLLQLAALQYSLVSALSVSSAGTKNNIAQNSQGQQHGNRHLNSNSNPIQYSQPQQVSSVSPASHLTTLPPLLTTIVQDSNHLEATLSQNQQALKQQQNQLFKQRSSSDEPEDSVPLATINNHSRNNQPAQRPPQYVDVSALVGRNQSSGVSGGNPNTGAPNGAGSAGLTAKSRSGLPECATQQVCNAIFVRMNYTQKLCECSSNYNWRCSHNLDPQDGHTIELTRKFDKRIYTQIKTCEPLREVRACKSPTDWTLLALQSERSGKAHYVVVCKCPTWASLEGPYTHNHPPYANIPGIRVYGMLCAHQTARSSAQTYATYNPTLSIYPEFPWSEALNVLNTTNLASTLDSH